jgi:hypothetical protein
MVAVHFQASLITFFFAPWCFSRSGPSGREIVGARFGRPKSALIGGDFIRSPDNLYERFGGISEAWYGNLVMSKLAGW